jgi:hypothetical protein
MPVLAIADIRRRLERLFPEGVEGRAFLVRELSAKTVATFLFLSAVGDPDSADVRRLRPSMVAWMDDDSLARADDADFVTEWHAAAIRGQRELKLFLEESGQTWERWYADNSRESIRDEVIRPLADTYGAVLRRSGVATTGSTAALTLDAPFAETFDPLIDENEVARRIEAWKDAHLGSAARARLSALRRLGGEDAVAVDMPGRGRRQLPAGVASDITREVVEVLAPQLLRQPFVLAICHSRDPVAADDQRELERVGLSLDPALALPDVLIIDVADETIWFVEVVASAGEINSRRRIELERWAVARGIDVSTARFVTAYRSRSDQAFRRTVGDLAWGTYVWFADEPFGIVQLREFSSAGDGLDQA